MKDQFKREINYLRVSVTDRCNLRCVYCMPEEGIELSGHEEILSFEEILRIIKAGVRVGIRKIRLTGGEPLVRKGIVELIRNIKAIPEIDDIALTTNGVLLADMAGVLKEAGLNRINISLDTLRPERYTQVTRVGHLNDVLAGIDVSLAAGLEPIKINSVIIRGFNEDEIIDLARLSMDRPLHVRFIELMPIGKTEEWNRSKQISSQEIYDTLNNHLGLLQPEKVVGSGPAKYYRLPGAKGTIGFIGAMSEHFCNECNRLRLTAEGKLRPCLQSPAETDLKEKLRQGAPESDLVEVFRTVISGKPQKHTMLEEGWGKNNRNMSQLGG